MSFSEVLEEGIAWGIPSFDIWDYTIGEVLRHIRAHRQRRRRELQERSVLAYHQSYMSGLVFSGKPLPEVWEVFPFWTQEETQKLQVEKYKKIMMQYAARGGGSVAGSGSQRD